MTLETIVTKYRPTTWETLVGNAEMYRALKRSIDSPTRPHAYLLTGPSGIGKTTTARIIADDIGAEVLEIDAASYSGVDNARQLVELGQHRPLSGADVRMFIIDECHTLSKAAWDALLKLLEEPPEHLFIALCTTELDKVKETIRTRCFHVLLRHLQPNDIGELLDVVCELEGWQVPNDVLQTVIQVSTGQPRKALSLLEAVHDAPDADEVKRIIDLGEIGDPLIELCRYLLDGGQDWQRVCEMLQHVAESDYDTAGAAMARYMANVMQNTEGGGRKSQRAFVLLDALLFPTQSYDKKASFFAAVGRMVWSK